MNKRKTRRKRDESPIEKQVAGIDIGSVQHWVAGPPNEDGTQNVRTFGTTTSDLIQIADWLAGQGIKSAAMESTSVYWIPLYELLESRGIQPVLVNARHLHNVPARAKTDLLDCEWLQLIHSRGLFLGSFRPTESISRLRALQRQMTCFAEDRARCVQWMQKALDQMNVQVHRAVTDLTGKTGMAIVRAIIAGERDPVRLARFRDARCRKSVEEIANYLTGTWRDEHVFNLKSAVELYDFLDQMVRTYEARLNQELKALQSPERQDKEPPRHPSPTKQRSLKRQGTEEARTTLWRVSGVDLTRIDGIGADAAQVVLTEVGIDLSKFPDEHHFVSWLRLCPRTAISGGKPLKKRRNGLGASRIANVLRMAAVSLHHSKTALGAQYRRIARRRDGKVAVSAMARKLAQLIYRALRFGQDYVDVGERAYEDRFKSQRVASLAQTAKALGFTLIQEDPGVAA
jgi:transposase